MLTWLVIGALTLISVHAVDWDVTTPLDEYMRSEDGEYRYEVIEQYDEGDHMVYMLNMTSQRWFDEELTTTPLWYHYLAIFVPNNPDPRFTDSAFLFVGGSDNTADPPTPGSGRMARLATFTRNVGCTVGYLLLVPNQPILFTGANVSRIEDSIIGYTWKLYIEDPDVPDPNINLLFPMTKSAKMALDTIEEFVPTVSESSHPEKYMVTGYSKRGWVTWLLACTDRRIFAIAPTVLDLLGFLPNLHHHNQAMGGWSWAFAPYWIEGVSQYLNHPRTAEIGNDIDPIEYNERLTMPKMVIVGGNDQFFPPDGSHYFFERLLEPKFMCLWENDDHGLGNHQDQIDRNLEAFFIASHTGFEFPTVNWQRSETETGGSIVLTGDEPLSIKGWVADTTNSTCEPLRNMTCRRDFRFTAINGATGIWYDEAPVEEHDSSYHLEFDRREDERFRGFFMEMTYPGPDDLELRFSTEINIIPDTFPYPPCETEEECRGILV